MNNYTKVEFAFSDEEMSAFLRKKKYTVAKVKSWESYTEYHNRVSFEDRSVWIAYKKKPSAAVLRQSEKSLESKCGLSMVFKKELRNKLLR